MKFKRPETETEWYNLVMVITALIFIVVFVAGVPLWIDIYNKYLTK